MLAGPGEVLIHGAPEGHDAHVLGSLVAGGLVSNLIHVCRDDARVDQFLTALGFFVPEVEVLVDERPKVNVPVYPLVVLPDSASRQVAPSEP